MKFPGFPMSKQLGMVHRFIKGTRPDTLLMLHGTGGDEDDLLALGRNLDAGANLLSPRGQVLENGMPRFFRRLSIGEFDLEDLEARTHELAGFISDSVDAYELDPTRIVAVGYSNGANIAASLLLLHPGVLRAAALLHAMVPFEPKERTLLRCTNILITAGRRDTMVSEGQAQRLADIFAASEAQVSLEWQPGGHELTQAELDTVRNWLDKQIERDDA